MTEVGSAWVLVDRDRDQLQLTRFDPAGHTYRAAAGSILAGSIDPPAPAASPFEGRLPVRVAARGQTNPEHLHNLDVVRQVPDLRFSELFATPESDGLATQYGIASADGTVQLGRRSDPQLSEVWGCFLGLLGPLPWGDTRIFEVENLSPLALSLPGAVFVNAALLSRQPRRAHLLYVTHELLHQWFGNLVRFAGEVDAWEAGVDAVARHVVESTDPRRLGPAFDRLAQRYLTSGLPELKERARLGAEALQAIRSSGLADWALLAGIGRDSLLKNGERIASAPLVAGPQKVGN